MKLTQLEVGVQFSKAQRDILFSVELVWGLRPSMPRRGQRFQVFGPLRGFDPLHLRSVSLAA